MKECVGRCTIMMNNCRLTRMRKIIISPSLILIVNVRIFKNIQQHGVYQGCQLIVKK